MKAIRVIIADDHAVLRDGLASLINAQPDMRVVGQAGDGIELVESCQNTSADVALVDISMPRCNGLRAISRLRVLCPATRVLVLTMHDNQKYLRKVLACGGSGYLVKQTAGKELIRAIREVHDGRSYISVSLSQNGLVDVVDGCAETAKRPRSTEVLSARELQVLELIAHGYTNKEVAAELGLATKSVDTYRVRLQEKLGLRGRASLVRYALEAGLLAGDPPGPSTPQDGDAE